MTAPLPAYGRAALSDLTPSLLAGMGVPGYDDVLGLDAGARVCLVLVDGLGEVLLRRHAGAAPFLAGLLPFARSLTVGFPSTTAASLSSIGTGLPPGGHGLLGYKLRDPDRDVLVNQLRWDAAVDPLRWQPRETAFEHAAAAGVVVRQVGPRAFASSGLTRAGMRGSDYIGANTAGERLASVVAALSGPGPRFVYAYHADLDLTGHITGVKSVAWQAELTHVDRLLEQLAAALPGGTTLLVTGDHGMVDPTELVDVEDDPALQAGVVLVGGEARARHVYTRRGAAADVLAAWTSVLGERAWVVSREQAVAEGWFGPTVDPAYLRRVGDVVAAARGGLAMVALQSEPHESRLVGMHGSLSDEELLVPLLRWPIPA